LAGFIILFSFGWPQNSVLLLRIEIMLKLKRISIAFKKIYWQVVLHPQLDAQTLARFAQTQKSAVWNSPPQVYYELQQRLCQCQDLMGVRGQLTNQLHALTAGPIVVECVKARLLQLIADIDVQIVEVDEEIKKVAQKADKNWAKSIELLQTIPGIGLLTACWLVMLSFNFTACKSGASLAHYAGLAPVERRSGTSVRGYPQVGGGGHTQLRNLLYMAALSACRFNPLLKRLVQNMIKSRALSGRPQRLQRLWRWFLRWTPRFSGKMWSSPRPFRDRSLLPAPSFFIWTVPPNRL
jgi:transposase